MFYLVLRLGDKHCFRQTHTGDVVVPPRLSLQFRARSEYKYFADRHVMPTAIYGVPERLSLFGNPWASRSLSSLID